ncbi:hypothetical protein BDZ85DRAFT_261084 [Elsinoe ampelina]|uniref:F-box domain-containing protein n=1 Tax=Elsinoe ampelina TaxID=302913 RepID=A0A6A6GFL8_9PEZI|nr:hypothetical protein BDZ85DRAFT_261084 [Elsinoe ampelina]
MSSWNESAGTDYAVVIWRPTPGTHADACTSTQGVAEKKMSLSGIFLPIACDLGIVFSCVLVIMSSLLPQELVDMVAGHCRDDHRTLSRFAQTCRTYQTLLAPRIFHTLVISDNLSNPLTRRTMNSDCTGQTYMSWSDMISFVQTVVAGSIVARFVRVVHAPHINPEHILNQLSDELRTIYRSVARPSARIDKGTYTAVPQ